KPSTMLFNRYERLVFLGDSNADTGNVYAMTEHTLPSPPHVYMGGRYSNGKMWTEHLSDFAAASESINLAYGWATIDNSIVAGTILMPDGSTRKEVPSLTDQIALLTSGKLQANDMVFVFAGSNDLNSLVDTGPAYIRKQSFTPESLASSLRRAVQDLCLAHGARNVLVMNVRSREDYPHIVALADPEKIRRVRVDTIALNAAIAREMAELQASLGREYNVGVFDTYAFQKRVIQNPVAAGIDPDVQTPCYSRDPSTPVAPDEQHEELVNPDTKLFVDGAHLAKRAQALLAAEIVKHIALALATE
ncbi:hypothetical protein IWW38_002644, partial [Coemansia aciculifera]